MDVGACRGDNVSPRRVTPQQTQERISRAQFCEVLLRHGWRCDGIPEDLGEDLLVRIFDDGRFSGLSFYVQLKSRAALVSPREAGKLISYAIAIKDLLHWENINPPAVLVLWDVAARRGLWIRVDAEISRLDQSRPNWRVVQDSGRGARSAQRKRSPTVTVHFPRECGCDAQGLTRLRHEIAMAALPSLSQGKELVIETKFSFPDTDEGRTKAQELENSFKRGDPVQIPAEYVDAVTFTSWWTRIFGEFQPQSASIAFEPIPSKEVVPFALTAQTASGRTVAIPYIPLHAVKRGLEEVTFSNASSNALFVLTLTAKAESVRSQFSGRHNRPGPATLEETLAYVELMQCFAEGCTLRLTPLSPGQGSPLVSTVPPMPNVAPPQQFVRVLNDLNFIRDRLGVSFTLSGDIERNDARFAAEVVSILKTRQCVNPGSFSFGLERGKAEEMLSTATPATTIRFSKQGDERVIILGSEIALGPCELTGQGTLTRDALLAAIQDDPAANYVPIRIVGATLTRTFPPIAPEQTGK